jgi:hypothetical protein
MAGNDAQRERRRARSQDVKCTDWVTRDLRRDVGRVSLPVCTGASYVLCPQALGSMQPARLTVRDPCLACPGGKLRPHGLPRSVRRPPSDEMETSQNHERPSGRRGLSHSSHQSPCFWNIVITGFPDRGRINAQAFLRPIFDPVTPTPSPPPRSRL